MTSVYDACFCDSGKKFKFCCYSIINDEASPVLAALSTEWPIYACYVGKGWREIGKTMLFVVRTMPNQLFFSSCFFLDVFCLGVKDAYLKPNLAKKDLEYLLDVMKKSDEAGIATISYEDARSMIFGAFVYAHSLGFGPHKNFETVKNALDPEEPFNDKFEFGYKGKPFYVMGPFDEEKLNVKVIIDRVKSLGGSFGVNFEEEAASLLGKK